MADFFQNAEKGSFPPLGGQVEALIHTKKRVVKRKISGRERKIAYGPNLNGDCTVNTCSVGRPGEGYFTL